ncbi:MAG: ribose-5-phosphate isomerase RpiA [Coriobacteriia bacterium]|nr:ribose-5-phosphate isomerase RpiA [Coriobacteriia bacterium]
MKRAAAYAALDYVGSDVIGVGAGSTAEAFIDVLVASDRRPRAAVAASERSRALLVEHGIAVVSLTADVLPLAVYVDGADEADGELRLIKGGGGALTREKVLASAARRFVCIVDESKLVRALGVFPLPVEVVPMAQAFVERELRALGGEPVAREGFTTDNGNIILDVTGLDFGDPNALELRIVALPGVVECGIFARRPADVLLVGTAAGVRRMERGRGGE